jgi:hypothetical protein
LNRGKDSPKTVETFDRAAVGLKKMRGAGVK